MAVVTRSPLIAGGTEGGPLGKRQVAGATLRQARVWVAWKVFRGHFELGRGPAPSMTVTDGQRPGCSAAAVWPSGQAGAGCLRPERAALGSGPSRPSGFRRLRPPSRCWAAPAAPGLWLLPEPVRVLVPTADLTATGSSAKTHFQTRSQHEVLGGHEVLATPFDPLRRGH